VRCGEGPAIMGGDTRGGTELEVEEGESRLTRVRHCYRSIQGEQTFAGLTATNARARGQL
jgi:hypothetical protein